MRFGIKDHIADTGWVSPMDLDAWLRGLGLEQYGTAFRENAVDGDVLPELTEGDLEKLGIPLGHRKRLMRAIRALFGQLPAADRPLASAYHHRPSRPVPLRLNAVRSPSSSAISLARLHSQPSSTLRT